MLHDPCRHSPGNGVYSSLPYSIIPDVPPHLPECGVQEDPWILQGQNDGGDFEEAAGAVEKEALVMENKATPKHLSPHRGPEIHSSDVDTDCYTRVVDPSSESLSRKSMPLKLRFATIPSSPSRVSQGAPPDTFPPLSPSNHVNSPSSCQHHPPPPSAVVLDTANNIKHTAPTTAPKPTSTLSIMKQFIRFCETTSLRGVPKIVRERDPRRRCLWSSFVFVFFSGCITCLAFLVNQYLNYDVIHQPKTIFESPKPFPSLTFCNLRPFSSVGVKLLEKNKVLTIEDYLSRVKDAFDERSRNLTFEQRKVITSSWGMGNYLYNLPPPLDPITLGHKLSDMLVDCKIFYRQGNFVTGNHCHQVGFWRRIQNDVYVNCYTFTARPDFIDKVLSLQMILYLGNELHATCYDCQRLILGAQLTGVRMQLHAAGTYPRIIEEGINLMTGTMTEVRFLPREWFMLEPPHGKCSPTIDPILTFNNESFTYSQEACRVKAIQEKILQQCGCINFPLQISDTLKERVAGVERCQGIHVPTVIDAPSSIFVPSLNTTIGTQQVSEEYVKKYLRNAHCAHSLSSEMGHESLDCYSPCVHYTYDTSISSAEWPAKVFQASVFDTVVKQITNIKRRLAEKRSDFEGGLNLRENILGLENLRERLRPYENVAKLAKVGKEEEAKEALRKLDFMEKNFLAIAVDRPNFDITRVEEKAVVSLTSLLSQVGGLLSIWIGLTFVCIVEVLELFLNIYDVVKQKAFHRRVKMDGL